MSNEAGEWLLDTLTEPEQVVAYEAALAAERRATVERIRARAEAIEHPCHDACVEQLHADCQCAAWVRQEVLAILDAGAQR